MYIDPKSESEADAADSAVITARCWSPHSTTGGIRLGECCFRGKSNQQLPRPFSTNWDHSTRTWSARLCGAMLRHRHRRGFPLPLAKSSSSLTGTCRGASSIPLCSAPFSAVYLFSPSHTKTSGKRYGKQIRPLQRDWWFSEPSIASAHARPKCLYNLMGVEKGASESEIKSAYYEVRPLPIIVFTHLLCRKPKSIIQM